MPRSYWSGILERCINRRHDLQRALSYQQYSVMRPGLADQFYLAWPAIRNWFGFQNDSRVTMYTVHGLPNLWMDTTRAHG